MLVAPWRKHLGLTFASSVGSGDLHDIRHAKPSQLANLPCTRILVREPPADELVVFSTRRVGKNRNSRRDAALHEIRCFERPAPPEPSDTTMMSAGATGSLTTSAHPAARRTGSRTEGTATMVAAANATTSRIGVHLGRRELMLGTSRATMASPIIPGRHTLSNRKKIAGRSRLKNRPRGRTGCARPVNRQPRRSISPRFGACRRINRQNQGLHGN